MPYKVTAHMCSSPNCNAVIKSGRYCQEHQAIHDAIPTVKPDRTERDRAYDKTRPSFSKRGYNKAWRDLSRKILDYNRVCVLCGERPSVLVHHNPPYVLGTKHEDYELTAVCMPCHNRIHKGQSYE